MNLEQANTISQLSTPVHVITPKTMAGVKVAGMVLARCEKNGYAYKYHSPKSWAKKYLDSKEFTLMEIDINAAASPHNPRDPKRVAHYMKCSAQDFDPIVVDTNKKKIGRSHLGFIPDVIVQDGKHRKAAMLAQGHTKILAWVGCKAAKKIKTGIVIDASAVKKANGHGITQARLTKFESHYEIYGATSPSVGLANTVMRQDSGEGGARPKMNAKKKMDGMGGPGMSVSQGSGHPKAMLQPPKLDAGATGDCTACGARSTGSLEDPSASDAQVPPDASDSGSSVDSSDQRQWLPDKPQMKAPGTTGKEPFEFGLNQAAAYGSNIGPRVKNTGASKSDMSRVLEAKSVKSGMLVKKIFTKKKKINAVAPPGYSEDTMHKLKRKVGTESAFKIAWSQHNKGKH